jgi:hypothetical protein
MRVLDSVMGCGRREFSDWQQSLSAWRVDAHYLTQPKLAVLAPTAADTDGAQPMHEGDDNRAALAARRCAAWRGRCLKARPRWLVVERVYLTGQWRASQVRTVTLTMTARRARSPVLLLQSYAGPTIGL